MTCLPRSSAWLRNKKICLELVADKEYMAGLRYVVGKYWSLSTHYDSDMGIGAGITLTY